MIKVKITKNIIRKSKNSLGLSAKQIVIALIGFLIGVLLYVSLKNVIPLSFLMWIIFFSVGGIIMFGVLNIQGMSLAQYIVKSFKGVDIRPYDSRGVFNSESVSEKTKK